jgi:hypothetical protein
LDIRALKIESSPQGRDMKKKGKNRKKKYEVAFIAHGALIQSRNGWRLKQVHLAKVGLEGQELGPPDSPFVDVDLFTSLPAMETTT